MKQGMGQWGLGAFLFVFFSSASLHAKDLKTDPKTLKEAYLAALKMSETVAFQKETLNQADEIDTQAKGSLAPTVSGTGVFLTQPTPNSQTANTLYPSSQSTIKFTADQPIFRGLRDFAALRQKKHLLGAQYFALLNAAKQLFYDLSTAYYNVLGYSEDEKNYKLEIEVNQKRLKELEQFFKIGRAQETDVLTFKANIASLEAQLETTHGQLESAKEVLAYLTGWNRDTSLKDDEEIGTSIADVSDYLSKIENRPDVQTAIANVKAYDEGVPISWGQHLPSLDVIGDYYVTRPGALSEVNWDVQLSISLPIFQGGVIQSQVRQARSVARQYGLQLSQTRRLAEQEVRQFYDNLYFDRNKMKKLDELVQISKKNYETEIQYYRNGLVTNLDVLQSITTYQDAQRQLDRARYTVRMDQTKLEAAVGQRTEMNEVKTLTEVSRDQDSNFKTSVYLLP